MLNRCLLVLTLTAVAGLAGRAARCAEDQPDPAAYREQVMRNGHLAKDVGEAFCWHASYAADDFLLAYEAWGDARWLEEAEKYYDFFVTKLRKDPDGCEGWIGADITNTPGLEEDALVGDAILCRHLVAFAEIVLRDETLKKRWGAKADAYVALATRIIWEKWNHRGAYYQDAAGLGSYHSHGRSIDLATQRWVERPGTLLSQPLNKSADAAIVLLRLWRITGREEYRERAERIFARGKALFQYYPDEERVVWSYWTPHSPFDVEGKAPKHWFGVHPSRGGYQAGEVAMFAEAYDSGLVFEQVDLERIIRTNRWMAQGDGKNPWRSADGTSEAGMSWTALARWDETIRSTYEQELSAKKDDTSRILLAYFKNVTLKHLNWDRQRVKDAAQVRVVRPPLQPGRLLTLALAIPDVIETVNNGRAKLITQTRAAGTLKIELLDAAGKEVLGALASLEVPKDAEYNAPRWDGANPKTGRKDEGEYRIRWTLNGESRTERVWVRPGVKRAEAGIAVLAPGTTLACDFEAALDPRWRLEGAALNAEQAHGGKQSLKLGEGQTATLVFGADDPLPVRVTFWVWEAGKKFGKASQNGAAWGIKTAEGDLFCARLAWRKYVDGDAEYIWVNTGENQWHNVWPCGVKRQEGWSQWVFDFTAPGAPKFTGHDQPMANLKAKYTPQGAVALYLQGGQQATGPLYVDDLTVEYPAKP